MSSFDYGNARLRAMKSRLLSRRQLECLAEYDSLQGLIAALVKTAYREPLQVALALASGMDCIMQALKNDLVNTIGQVRGFYQDQAGVMVGLLLRAYDIHNIKAILRGLANLTSPIEILMTMIPVGELQEDVLSDLARAPGPRGAIDMLASMRSELARPLLKLRTEHPGADTLAMELAVDQWYFHQSFQIMPRFRQEGRWLFAALQLDADLHNLLSVIRLAHAPDEHAFLRQWLGTEDPRGLFLGPGCLSFDTLVHAGGQDTLEAAVEALKDTPYEIPLMAGLAAYSQSKRLSDFEKHLHTHRLNWLAGLIAKDPLGIGVVLGYFALKTNEVRNLRWIGQGINLGLSVDRIRSELEIAI